MIIYGLDFTSAPNDATSKAQKQKRLMLAKCFFSENELKFDSFILLNREKGSFAGVVNWLSGLGEFGQDWVAGIDFPFCQPAKLVESLNWPRNWEEYVQHIQTLGKDAFEAQLREYKRNAPIGNKHLYRKIDTLTDSQSPMTLEYTPVGKMFFKGAPLLCSSGDCIVPLRMNNSSKIVIEAYPKIVASKWIERRRYKNDDPKKNNDEMLAARRDLLQAVRGRESSNSRKSFYDWYGFDFSMNDADADACVNDFTGDKLDSVLCAMQAAWAYLQGREKNYGVPVNVDLLEGWIPDPSTLMATI